MESTRKKAKRNKEKPSEKYIGRDEYINIVSEWLDNGHPKTKILELTGYAGIGKSSISELIMESLKTNSQEPKYLFASYSFEDEKPDGIADLLFNLREQLGINYEDENKKQKNDKSNKIEFRFFDPTRLVYVTQTGYNKKITKKDDKSKKRSLSSVLDYLGVCLEFGGLVASVTPAATIVGLIKGIREAIKTFKQSEKLIDGVNKLKDYLAEITFKDKEVEELKEYLQNIDKNELDEELVKYFIVDLNNRKNSNPIVIILDALDYFQGTKDNNGMIDDLKQYLFFEDEELGLIYSTENVYWILCNREQDDLEDLNSIEVQGLEKNYVVELLKETIKEPEIIEYIYEATEGNPLAIELYEDLYIKISEKREPQIEDFTIDLSSNIKKTIKLYRIIKRYKNRLNQTQSSLLKLFAFMGEFKEKDVLLLKELYKEREKKEFDEMQVGTNDFDDLLESSIIIQKEENIYQLKRPIRDFVYHDVTFSDKNKKKLSNSYLTLILTQFDNDPDYYGDRFIDFIKKNYDAVDDYDLFMQTYKTVRDFYSINSRRTAMNMDFLVYKNTKDNENIPALTKKDIALNLYQSINNNNLGNLKLLQSETITNLIDELKEKLEIIEEFSGNVLDQFTPVQVGGLENEAEDNLTRGNEGIDLEVLEIEFKEELAETMISIAQFESVIEGWMTKKELADELLRQGDYCKAIEIKKDVLWELTKNEVIIRQYYDDNDYVDELFTSLIISILETLRQQNNPKDLSESIKILEDYKNVCPIDDGLFMQDMIVEKTLINQLSDGEACQEIINAFTTTILNPFSFKEACKMNNESLGMMRDEFIDVCKKDSGLREKMIDELIKASEKDSELREVMVEGLIEARKKDSESIEITEDEIYTEARKKNNAFFEKMLNELEETCEKTAESRETGEGNHIIMLIHIIYDAIIRNLKEHVHKHKPEDYVHIHMKHRCWIWNTPFQYCEYVDRLCSFIRNYYYVSELNGNSNVIKKITDNLYNIVFENSQDHTLLVYHQQKDILNHIIEHYQFVINNDNYKEIESKIAEIMKLKEELGVE